MKNAVITKKANRTADNRTQVIYYDEQGNAIIAKEYDSNNNILFYHDAKTGYRKHFEYDAEGKLIRTLDSNGKSEYRFTETPIRKVMGGMKVVENDLQAEVPAEETADTAEIVKIETTNRINGYIIPSPAKVGNAIRPWDELRTTVANMMRGAL